MRLLEVDVLTDFMKGVAAGWCDFLGLSANCFQKALSAFVCNHSSWIEAHPRLT